MKTVKTVTLLWYACPTLWHKDPTGSVELTGAVRCFAARSLWRRSLRIGVESSSLDCRSGLSIEEEAAGCLRPVEGKKKLEKRCLCDSNCSLVIRVLKLPWRWQEAWARRNARGLAWIVVKFAPIC